MTPPVDPELLKILCCPETHQPLAEADAATVAALNTRIQRGTLHNRAGQRVIEAVEGALVRGDRQYAYPVRHGIPVLLIDEALPLTPA